MATGSGVGRTVKGSDESFEHTCSTCVKKNINREAAQYCVDCQDYYCSTCVEFHDVIPVLAGHRILGKSEFPTDGSLVQLPTERCRAHPTKLVDMYCQNHDQIGCHVCMAVKHRSCKDVFYIPEEIENILHGEDKKIIEGDLKKANDKLISVITSRREYLDELNNDKVAILDLIKNFRQEINSRLDELEKMTKIDFNTKYDKIQNKLTTEISLMTDITKEMETFQQQLNSPGGNRSQQFVCFKKCQEKISESDKISKQVDEDPHVSIEFKSDESIEKLLSGLKSLGEITEKTSCRSVQVQQHSALYKVTGRHEYNASTRSGRMYGSCILTDGTLLLPDYGMKKLVRLDSSTYKVIDECDMSAGPIAVCEISSQEAGVTLNNNTIQLVSLGSKMAPTRSITMNNFCYGLAFSNGEMFVSDMKNQVFVYDTSGTLLRTICKDQSGDDIFSCTKHITMSDDGSKIYVADKTGVIVLGINGELLTRFCDPELSGAEGVCTDGCGNMFVSGNSSNNVVQFGQSGNTIGVIANKSDGISGPQSVCYDRSTSRMIVTNYSSSINVFDLV